MQSNIFELIDLLVKMSGSKYNLDELKAELDDVESSILKVQKKLSNLEEEMNDDKYFDASSEIVDRNIKISLVKKIKKLNKIKNDIEKDLESSKSEEIKLHDELDKVREEIKSANKYNDIINKSVSESDAYNNMIASENERISNLVTRKDQIEESYNSVQKKVEYLANSIAEIEEKISKENERLNEVENNLTNIKSYIDIDEKEKDEKRYYDIKNHLDELYARKEEIENDAVYLAGKIKELIANEQKDEVEDEFNKLLDVVKAIPYMELETADIETEKAKLDKELKDYDDEISHKEYQTMDKEFIEERIAYLTKDLQNINEAINEYTNKLSKIKEENDLLSSKVYNAEMQISKINDSLIDYEAYDYENNELPKSVVQASNNKLIEERDNISVIAENYRKDIVNKLSDIEDLNSKIEALKSESELKEKELDELEKKGALTTKSVNILEEERDKIKLEKINKSILDLKNREEFSKSVSAIYDEFQMLISSLEFVDKKTRSKILYEEINNETKDAEPENMEEETKEPTIEEASVETPEVVEEVVETPVDEVKEEPSEEVNVEETSTPLVEEKTEDLNIQTSSEMVFEPMTENVEETKEEPKLRVVELYDIPSDLSENKGDDFMVNDFKDDDYVDLETAITSMEDK